jgi:thioesterase domain-containing protein
MMLSPRTLRRSQRHGPYRIGGWSMGAAAAFEMARQLAALEMAPEALVLIDPPDPPRTNHARSEAEGASPSRELDDTTLTAWFLEDVANLGIRLSLRREDLRRLGQEEWCAAPARPCARPASRPPRQTRRA